MGATVVKEKGAQRAAARRRRKRGQHRCRWRSPATASELLHHRRELVRRQPAAERADHQQHLQQGSSEDRSRRHGGAPTAHLPPSGMTCNVVGTTLSCTGSVAANTPVTTNHARSDTRTGRARRRQRTTSRRAAWRSTTSPCRPADRRAQVATVNRRRTPKQSSSADVAQLVEHFTRNEGGPRFESGASALSQGRTEADLALIATRDGAARRWEARAGGRA